MFRILYDYCRISKKKVAAVPEALQVIIDERNAEPHTGTMREHSSFSRELQTGK